MRRGRKVLAAAIVLLALVIVREAFFSMTSYYVIVPGAKLFTDSKAAAGWLHRGGKGQSFIVTRIVSGRRESYFIQYPGEKGGWVSGCGNWTAPRFPLVATGDFNPPCLLVGIVGSDPPKTTPPERSPVFESRSVAFIADDGTGLKVLWGAE